MPIIDHTAGPIVDFHEFIEENDITVEIDRAKNNNICADIKDGEIIQLLEYEKERESLLINLYLGIAQ